MGRSIDENSVQDAVVKPGSLATYAWLCKGMVCWAIRAAFSKSIQTNRNYRLS